MSVKKSVTALNGMVHKPASIFYSNSASGGESLNVVAIMSTPLIHEFSLVGVPADSLD